jgi:predicted nuclease of predicted toxin-antitoxin system
MKFLIDENIGLDVVRFLQEEGYNVALANEHEFGLADPEILRRALAEKRIIITHDLDFGELVFEKNLPHAGVILLRLKINTVKLHIKALQSFLKSHQEQEIQNKFWSLDERVFMEESFPIQ